MTIEKKTYSERVNIINQLVEFYYKYDQFQTTYLDYEIAYRIYSSLYDQNRICMTFEDGELLGYCENLRIGYEELGKIICGENVYSHLDDWEISFGPIAYVANITIKPENRGTGVIKDLTKQFFTANQGAKYFVGRAFRKRHQPVKVFDFHESYLKWIKE